MVNIRDPSGILSSKFAVFGKQNGIKYNLIPPYHPASNGVMERNVQILKQELHKSAKQQPKLTN